jgi:hypothetical protein
MRYINEDNDRVCAECVYWCVGSGPSSREKKVYIPPGCLLGKDRLDKNSPACGEFSEDSADLFGQHY